MFQVAIVMVDNGFMVQVPAPTQHGAPPAPPKTLVFPDLDSAINYARDIFEQVQAGVSAQAEKHAKLMEEAAAETEAATSDEPESE